MRSTTIAAVAWAAALGCGSSSSESSFTTCDQTRSSCIAGNCQVVEECLVDECEAEISYEFEGEEYESQCTFGTTVTTTRYPLEGGAGSVEQVRDLEQCFYKVDVEFNDIDQVRRCTLVQDCSVRELSCGPSAPGNPNCERAGPLTPCPPRSRGAGEGGDSLG
jgi:hypothetical protein